MLGDSGVHRSRALSVAARAQIGALALAAVCVGAVFVPMPFLNSATPGDTGDSPTSPSDPSPPIDPAPRAGDAPDPVFMAERFNNAAVRADPSEAPIDPEPDTEPVVVAPAGVQYLGCVLGRSARRALLRIDGSQHLIPEGASVEGIEVVRVSASAATIRDAEGERTLTITKRSDSSFSSGGTPPSPLAGSTDDAEQAQLDRERNEMLERARQLRRENRPRPADSRRENPE